jgi:prephenate dehydrogenase
MIVTIIGTGLMGGSFALALRERGLASHIIGVDRDAGHLEKALALGLIDEAAEPEAAISRSALVVFSIPVDAMSGMLSGLLNLADKQVFMDMGSTKADIVGVVQQHPNRGRFVATHPMWGTEYSGPDAAIKGAFTGKAVVICDQAHCDTDALELAKDIYEKIGMRIIYMDAMAHDLHAAYISHISHITSFALANTVLEKEKEDEAIFELASAGFESTVRLAKSNPGMWVPIFRQNRDNVLDVLNEHISQLRKFKSCLEKENYTYLAELIEQANKIQRIIR